MSIYINNYSPDTRVHVYATQFQPKNPKSMKIALERGIANKIQLTKFKFATWKNMFESNNSIGDEIKYVFDRQK